MDKKDLKKLLKPLMKECVKEILMEEGMLKVLNEVVQPKPSSIGLGKLSPQQLENVKKTYPEGTILQDPEEARRKLKENHQKILNEIGNSGYVSAGFNPFANTAALDAALAPPDDSQINESVQAPRNVPPSMQNIDPNDPGVDIRGIMNIASGKWKKHMNGKG